MEYGYQTYGERIAGKFDELYPEIDPSMIDVLADLAGDGQALELGSGTGRAAIPLYRMGVEVHGIDASPRMIEQMKGKPDGEGVTVTEGSFAEFELGMSFDLIYVVFNTFFGLLSQADQISCMRSVARHLKPGGAFLVEAFIPDLTRFDRGQRVSAVSIDQDRVRIDVS